jgi:hypothetical protein
MLALPVSNETGHAALAEAGRHQRLIGRRLVGMSAADDQGVEAVGGGDGQSEADAATARITPEMGPLDAEVVQHGDDVATRGHGIGGRLVRPVAGATPAIDRINR